MKVCLEPGCWRPAAGPRCQEHERAHQAARNRLPGRAPRRTRTYMDTPVGTRCLCCGATEDLTRHHVTPLALGGGALLVTMCRPCNSSIGARVMVDLRCPLHGGTEA